VTQSAATATLVARIAIVRFIGVRFMSVSATVPAKSSGHCLKSFTFQLLSWVASFQTVNGKFRINFQQSLHRKKLREPQIAAGALSRRFFDRIAPNWGGLRGNKIAFKTFPASHELPRAMLRLVLRAAYIV
jgi:hypothetical protein